MRLLVLLALLPSVALADEVDLTRRERTGQPATWVVRAEGGSAYAPYGYAGGVLSWLTDGGFEFEGGGGAGFPGVQLGFAARRLFAEGGTGLVLEIALAGNTRINRAAAEESASTPTAAVHSTSSLWTNIGGGFEQRGDFLDINVVASIVFTTASLTPKWAIHGGVGFGF